jgi:hypothetical protein
MKVLAYMLFMFLTSNTGAAALGTVQERRKPPTLPDTISSAEPTPNMGYEELWRLQNEFYEKWIMPNNAKEAESINSTVFSDNVRSIHASHSW